jgi:hypothetical protein
MEESAVESSIERVDFASQAESTPDASSAPTVPFHAGWANFIAAW